MKTFESEWRARFERFGRMYTGEADISGWSEAGLRRRVALFSSLVATLPLPATGTVLDLGCGAGTYVRHLAGLGHRAVGIDYSVPSLGHALTADPGRKGAYVAGEADRLPFGDTGFDFVMCVGVLQALSESERVLDEITRVLRPGGVALVEILNGRGLRARLQRGRERLLRKPPRVRTYDPVDVRRSLRARGLAPVREAALRLPPRSLPGLERLFDWSPVSRALNAWPGLAQATTHALWLIARKPPLPGDRLP